MFDGIEKPFISGSETVLALYADEIRELIQFGDGRVKFFEGEFLSLFFQYIAYFLVHIQTYQDALQFSFEFITLLLTLQLHQHCLLRRGLLAAELYQEVVALTENRDQCVKLGDIGEGGVVEQVSIISIEEGAIHVQYQLMKNNNHYNSGADSDYTYQIYIAYACIAIFVLILIIFFIKQLCCPLTQENNYTQTKNPSQQRQHYSRFMPAKLGAELNMGENSNCPVCLEEIGDHEEARQTICSHFFHKQCLDLWCKKNFNCPFCREQFGLDVIQMRIKRNLSFMSYQRSSNLQHSLLDRDFVAQRQIQNLQMNGQSYFLNNNIINQYKSRRSNSQQNSFNGVILASRGYYYNNQSKVVHNVNQQASQQIYTLKKSLCDSQYLSGNNKGRYDNNASKVMHSINQQASLQIEQNSLQQSCKSQFQSL